MNKLLHRQIKKFSGDVDTPQSLDLLFKAISDAYDGFDEDRSLIERALDTSSEELTETNRKLRQEVSERKETQEQIERTLSLLTATLESTADGILVVDLKGKVVSCNHKFQQLWRIPDEIIESKDDDKLLAFVLDQLTDPQEFLAGVRRLYADVEKESFDLVKFKDGRVFERFSQPQKVGDKIAGRVWSFNNVTERKRAEERLLVVNSLQRLLLPPAPIEQKLKFVTDAVVRILDADFARVWVIKPGDRCEAGCIHAEATEGPHVCRFRDKCLHLTASSGRYTHLDGKGHRRVPFGCYKIGLIAAAEQDKFLTNDAATDPHVHNHDWAKELGLVSFAGYRLTRTDGTPLGVLAMFSKHPISPEEDALLEGIAHSTSLVLHTSRTEEAVNKLNKDLKSTVALLTRSNKQLREFAHLAAHDLKTPLRGINVLAQWLANDYRKKFGKKGLQLIDLLEAKVERLNKLINAILQYSTIDRERHREHPVDFNGLVGTILVEIKPPPSVKITINKPLPVVICREAHLRQVFYHLLSNAIRFMDKPEGRITIDCSDKNDCWEFSVADNGPGIAQQHFERIFRLFQVLGDSAQSESSGIGLTVVRKIIELYDGQIWLTSELGQGSTFFFTLPKTISVTDNEKLLLAASS